MIIEGCAGLRLVATQQYRTWVYRYKAQDGRMKQLKLGRWPAMSLPSAVAAWEAKRLLRESGDDPVAEKKAVAQEKKAVAARSAAPRRYTVEAMLEDFLVRYIEQHRAPKGAKEVRRMFKTMCGPINSLQPEGVTRSVAFDLIDSHRRTPVLANSLRRELGLCWDWALDAGKIKEATPNWWRMVLRGKLKSKGRVMSGKHIGTVKRVLSETELSLLIPWLPNFPESTADILTLYLWTLMRGAEITAIEGREVSEEKDGLWWTIPKAKTKNRNRDTATDIRVPLVGRAKEVVLRRLKLYGPGYLFPSRIPGRCIEQKVVSERVYYHQPYASMRDEYKRVRLPVSNWGAHDLRRTGRTLLTKMGCPTDVAEAAIGHVQPGIEGVYNRYSYDEEKRVWITRLSDLLEKLASPSQPVEA
ncbi:integrase family protein [Uliginosibacterium sediminicola]|uniref:Integrase family protein n=1 Tax=Uliginosibacterium sediminicola TaxID=2024550 RepID=A0ABU9YWP9_9RHOO